MMGAITVTRKWSQAQAVALCRAIETIAPKYGCHVALTGGTLYHFGDRKDADILFYRIRQTPEIDVDGLIEALRGIGVIPGEDFGWCHKATFEGRPIDFFFPERAQGNTAEPPEYGGQPALTPEQEIAERDATIARMSLDITAAEKWARDYETAHGPFKSDPPLPGFMIAF